MINLKIDTKEKFHEILLMEPQLTANMTAEIQHILSAYLKKHVKNVILQFSEVETIDTNMAEILVLIQQAFYEKGASFIICNIKPAVKDFLNKEQLLDVINIAPTLSEAWDILQMEEIERELFD